MASISFSVSGSVDAGSTATVSWNSGSNAATKYINSTGINAYPRVTPKAQSVGTGTYTFGNYLGAFTATFQEPVTNAGVAVASHSVNYTLRTGNTGGTILATSNSVTVYRTPTAPTSLTKQSGTDTSITMRVSGGSFGNLQIKRGSGSYQTADSNGDVTFTGLSASTSYTFTARRLNGTNDSTTITANASTSAANLPDAPSVTAGKSVITNGFNLTTTTSGSSNGTITYRWTTSARGGYDTGYVSSSNLGVGVEWVGSTWTVQAKASISGQSDVFSNTSSTTLPTFSVSGPSSMTEGTSQFFSNSVTNSASSTLYWQVTPTADFTTSSGSVSAGGQVSVAAASDGVTEGTENATYSLYINNIFNSLNLVATKSFTVSDAQASITTPSAPTVSSDNAELANVQVTVQLPNGDTSSGGTLQFGQSTTNSAPSSWSTGSFATFTHPRGETRYYWARRSANNVSNSTSLAVSYLTTFDSSVTISPSTRQVNTGDASATFTITNPSGSNTLFGNSVYRLVTSSISPGWRASKAGESDGNADIVLNQSEGDLPPEGTAATYTYQLSGKRRTDKGGPPNNDSEFTDISGQAVTVERLVTTITLSPTTMNEGATQELTTANNKISGLANNTTYYWRLFDQAYFSSTTGSITSSSTGTISAGSGISIQTINDNTATGNKTGTVKLYATAANRTADTNAISTATFTISDTSTGGISGGGSGPSATATYGLVIKSSSGNAVISPSQRSAGLILENTIGSTAIPNNGGSRTFSGSDAPEITSNNEAQVIILISPGIGSATSGGAITISRGSGTFTITNNSADDIPANTPYYIVRC